MINYQDYPNKLKEADIKYYDIDTIVPMGKLNRAYFHLSDDFPILMHSHSFYEINIVVKGYGRHYIENTNCSAEIGNVFAIPPKVRHGYWSSGDLEIFHVLIPDTFFSTYSNILANITGYHILFEIEPRIRSNYQDNIALKLSKRDLKRLMSDFIMLSEQPYDITFEIRTLLLISEFSNMISNEFNIKTPSNKNCDYLAIMKSINYIRTHYNINISVNELAADANMSPSTFLRHFKLICRTTPLKYLANYRVTLAANQLLNTEKSVTDIAMDCGFFDSAHMNKLFKKTYGMTPKEYKNKYKREENLTLTIG